MYILCENAYNAVLQVHLQFLFVDRCVGLGSYYILIILYYILMTLLHDYITTLYST